MWRRGRRYGGRGGCVDCIKGAGDTLRLLVYKPRVGRSSPVSRGVSMQITLIFVHNMFAQARVSRGAVLYQLRPIVSPCTVSRLALHRPPLDAITPPREPTRLPSACPHGTPSSRATRATLPPPLAQPICTRLPIASTQKANDLAALREQIPILHAQRWGASRASGGFCCTFGDFGLPLGREPTAVSRAHARK